MATLPGFNRIRLRKVGSTVENPLTFVSPGLVRSGDSVSNALSTGFPGGGTINGGTGSGDALTIRSSSNGGTLTGPITMVSGLVELRQGVTPTILRVYGTYSAAGANFERGDFSWTATTLFIGASAAGTGTLRPVVFTGSGFTMSNDLAPGVSKGTAIGSAAIPFGTIFANQFEAPATTIGVVLSGAATGIIFSGAGTQSISKSAGSLFIRSTDANDIVFQANNIETFRLSAAAGARILFATASIAANGTVATAMTNLGPVGSHTTIQEWLTCQSPTSGGVQRWIPMF